MSQNVLFIFHKFNSYLAFDSFCAPTKKKNLIFFIGIEIFRWSEKYFYDADLAYKLIAFLPHTQLISINDLHEKKKNIIMYKNFADLHSV